VEGQEETKRKKETGNVIYIYLVYFYIVTDLINALLGNRSVNSTTNNGNGVL
jgi:hypothetical protein